MNAGIALLSRVSAAVKRGADEVLITAGTSAVVVGVALIYVPAAVIIGGLLLVLLGVGRLRA